MKRFFGISLTALAVVSMALSVMAFTASAAPVSGNGPDCTTHPDNPNCVTPDPDECEDGSTGDCNGVPDQPPGDPNPNPNGCENGEPDCEPTEEPTEEPTAEPTEEPTGEPTEEPTGEPTEEPTGEPTDEPEPEAAKVDVCHYAPGNPHIINVSVHSVDDANGLNGHGDHELDSWESFVFDGVTYDGQGDFPGLCGDQPEPTATVEVTPTREPTQPPCDPAACPEVTPTPTRERDNPPTAPQTGGGWEAVGLALMALSFASGAGGIKLLRRRGN